MRHMRFSYMAVGVGVLLLMSLALPLITADGDSLSPVRDGEIKGKPQWAADKKPPKDDDTPDDGGTSTVDKWAVVIGIADYKGIANDLSYTDDDAVDMYDYLLTKGYPKYNIKLLLNRKANSKNILGAIDWMAGKEGKESECVFFYSGHGSTYDGYDDGDTEYRDESIVSWDLYLILDGMLRDRFSSFESEKIAFIFDSCFSGGMDDLAGSGRIVVSACGETEYSYDGSSSMANGVFSYYYFEGLSLSNTIEGAFDYADELASDYIFDEYGATMNPDMVDQYSGTWNF
jgi:hypothetical protein